MNVTLIWTIWSRREFYDLVSLKAWNPNWKNVSSLQVVFFSKSDDRKMVSFGILEICTCSRIKLPCTKPFHCILFKWWIWYISYVISAARLCCWSFFSLWFWKFVLCFSMFFLVPPEKNRTRRNPVEWIPWKWGTLSPKLKYLGGSDEFLQGRTIFAWHFIATYSRRLVTPKGSEKVGESYPKWSKQMRTPTKKLPVLCLIFAKLSP